MGLYNKLSGNCHKSIAIIGNITLLPCNYKIHNEKNIKESVGGRKPVLF